jgi:hypothetical protein
VGSSIRIREEAFSPEREAGVRIWQTRAMSAPRLLLSAPNLLLSSVWGENAIVLVEEPSGSGEYTAHLVALDTGSSSVIAASARSVQFVPEGGVAFLAKTRSGKFALRSTSGRVPAFEGDAWGFGFTPDRTRVVLTLPSERGHTLAILPAAGGEPSVIDRGVDEWRFTQDPELLLVFADRRSHHAPSRLDMFADTVALRLVSLRGAPPRTLATDACRYQPGISLSPDGRYCAFALRSTAKEVFFAPIAPAGPVLSLGDHVEHFAFTPDGSAVVISCEDEPTLAYVPYAGAPDLARKRALAGPLRRPGWPRHGWFAFTHDAIVACGHGENGMPELQRVPLEGGEVVRLCQVADPGATVLSADWLLATRTRWDGSAHVRITELVSMRGGPARVIDDIRDPHLGLAFSPDGTRFAWLTGDAQRGQRGGLYVARVEAPSHATLLLEEIDRFRWHSDDAILAEKTPRCEPLTPAELWHVPVA